MNTMPSLLGSLWSDQLGATDGFGSSSPFPSESKQHTHSFGENLGKSRPSPTSPPSSFPTVLRAPPSRPSAWQAERVEVAPQLEPEEGEEEELLEDDAVVEPSLPLTLASLSETAELLLKEGHGARGARGYGWGWMGMDGDGE